MYSYQQWVDEFDSIYGATSQNPPQMPLAPEPPLTMTELKLLENWAAGGFLP